MQNKSDIIIDEMIAFFGDRFDDYGIRGHFIDFKAYDYFSVQFEYDDVKFACYIRIGESRMKLDNSQERWDSADFNVFLKELKEEIELRIPDKYLMTKGWL